MVVVGGWEVVARGSGVFLCGGVGKVLGEEWENKKWKN